MASHCTRSSSIPRQYHRIAREERFSVTEAVHLKLKLQALDNALSSTNLRDHGTVDMKRITDACQSRPFHETVYVDGSEEFYLLVKGISRPDLVPNVYIDAYKAVLQRRPHVNEYRVSDFTKGVDPTFSEIRVLLGRIDDLCETDLEGAFNRLDDRVKPFPFLQLPAELRLQVYAELLPREPHLALIYQPHWDHKPPRIRLDILRLNKQVLDEVVKYFYEKRTLFLVAARDKASQTLSSEYLSRFYQLLATMNPHTRQSFTKLEIQIGYLSGQSFTPKRYLNVSPIPDAMQEIFALLPGLQTLVISFGPLPFIAGDTYRIVRERLDTVYWLIDCVPAQIDVRWDLTRAFTVRFKADEQPLRRIVAKRGAVCMGESIVAQLETLRKQSSDKRPQQGRLADYIGNRYV